MVKGIKAGYSWRVEWFSGAENALAERCYEDMNQAIRFMNDIKSNGDVFIGISKCFR